MQSVAETKSYAARAEKLLDISERNTAIQLIACDPLAGDLIEGTGGIRKIRFAKDGKGKSGGVRIIYYYHNAAIPILLLAIFGKNEQANLSKAERNALAHMVKHIKHAIKG